MRKLLLILTAVAALAVAAVPTATPKSHAPQLKVALIAPSAHNDLAFTQSMHHALLNLQKKFDFQLSVSENQFVVANAANIMHQYAQEGYDLIIAHGSQYGATVQQLAPQFPKTTFAWGTAGETYGLPNVYAYQAASEQGGYVNGFIASLMSKTHVLGVIGPIAVGDAKLYVDGFVAGAKAAEQEDGCSRRVHGLVQRPEPDVEAGVAVHRAEGRCPDGQLAVGRRCDQRRPREPRHVVRHAVDPGVTRPEEHRGDADVRLDADPQPDAHADAGRQEGRRHLHDHAEERRRERPVQQGVQHVEDRSRPRAAQIIARISSGKIKIPAGQ